MLEDLFIAAARSLRNNGWRQQDDPMLFWHPEFGAHEFFKACYIQCNVERVRRHKRLKTIAVYLTLASLAVLFGYALFILKGLL